MRLKALLRNGRLALGSIELRWEMVRRRPASSPAACPATFPTPPYSLHIGPGPQWEKPDERWLTVDVDPLRADVVVNWTVQPPRPSVGVEAVIQLTVQGGDAAPVTGAKMQCIAQMSHPGMTPIVATVAERGPGTYEARLQFSMAGDWVLTASGELPDGRRIESSFQVPDVQPAQSTVPSR